MKLQRLVIITGLSGSGKRTVYKAFEDLGYFCVDNIPIQLIPRLIQLSEATEGRIDRLAVVADARLGEAIHELEKLMTDLRSQAGHTALLFVEASENVLARRFSETRRVHPLASDRDVLDGIHEEKRKLADIKAMADLVLDTSNYTVHELRRFVGEQFSEAADNEPIVVTLMSFGYKHGIPINADLVLDVRFLPNPNFEPELKAKTGMDPEVVRYMERFADTGTLLYKLTDLLQYLIPKYVDEGKSYLTVAVGCTGGRHRSVMIAEALKQRLKAAGTRANLVHRDVHAQQN